MKRIILSIMFLLVVAGAEAKKTTDKMSVENLSVEQAGDNLNVSFDARIARRAARGSMTYIYAPMVTDGVNKVSLTPVIVQNRKSAVAWERHEWAAEAKADHTDGIHVRNNSQMPYNASVAFQPWMHNASVVVEEVTAGCCSAKTSESLLAQGIAPQWVAPKAEVIVPDKTLIEQLTEAFQFVYPDSLLNLDEPMKFYKNEKSDALIVYFKLNKYDIEPDYMGNRQVLTNLLAVVEMINSNPHADISKVVIAGFASPEGPFAFNDRLAWERAVSVKEYIMKSTGLPAADVALFNGSADWYGLRELVAADDNVPGQKELLDIIDNTKMWDAKKSEGRQTMMKKMNGGKTYEYLMENILPKLRSSAFIRVYYKEK